MALPIEDYALLSDCRSAGLVGRDGSIDWLCFPRFDSAACFAALLGSEANGRWKIAPSGRHEASRRYVDGTLVLETTFRADGGVCRLIDCMVLDDSSPTLIRLVEGVEGSVELDLSMTIRFDYGAIVPWVRRLAGRHGISAVAGPEALLVASPVPLHGRDLHTEAKFRVSAGESLPFTLIWHRSSQPLPRLPPEPLADVRRTIEKWSAWASQSTYNGIDQAGVRRSLLTLKALTYEPTGGIVAAATTSLPETIGGERNWDYRYGWIRDSAFTLQALLMAGYRREAENWNQWLLRAVAGTPSQVNIMYGVGGERRLPELTLDWLSGYESSRPVRVGNAAFNQNQLDIFGELMLASDLGRRSGLPHSADSWRVERNLVDYLGERWTRPDEGIWEVRGPKRHFTHSKVMAWLALDRAVKAVREFGLEGDAQGWGALRDKIHADVCAEGFDSKLNSFVQSYGSKELDASLLMLLICGFLPPDDPRMIGTVKAVEKHLLVDGFVLRYRAREEIDGLKGADGSFLVCSFWLADCYALMGRPEQARELFDRLCALRNDVGLLSEEYDVPRKRLVGNFPQTFSHTGHVVTAGTLSRLCSPLPGSQSR